MGITVSPYKKKKPDPDRKKTKTVRKPITTKSFAKGEVTKSGKFGSMSNTDVKKRSKRVGGGHINKADGKRFANADLARVNKAAGEAARRARKRNTR